MKSFDEMVQDVVREKLSGNVIEKVIEEKLQNAISTACDDMFRWSGDGKKLIEDKLKDMMLPALENSDFSDYTKKLDVAFVFIILWAIAFPDTAWDSADGFIFIR